MSRLHMSRLHRHPSRIRSTTSPPAVNPYRQPAPDTTATLPALDATASQPEPETAYHQASPLPYNPSQETDKYIPVNEMESSSFFTDPEPAEEQEPKKKREKPAKPSKPSVPNARPRSRRPKKKPRQRKPKGSRPPRRRVPNAPSLTGMEDCREGLPPAEGHRRSRCHRRPRGRRRRRIGDRRKQPNRRSVLRHHRSRRSHEDHLRRRRDLRKRPRLRFRSEQHGGGRRDYQEGYRRLSKTPVGRVATQYIAKGSQLTNASTAGKDNPESLAAAIGDGMEAVTISVDAQSGMGGMLRVNDRVKVIQPNDGSLGADGFTVIADSVRIAALDGNFSSGSGSSDGYSTVTLEVTPEQAGKIRTAGGLTLTLPSSADTTESGE